MYLALTNTYPGEWARGATEAKALDGLAWRGPVRGRGFLVVRIHDAWIDPRVDQFGRVFADRGPLLEALADVAPARAEKIERTEAPVIAEAWRLTHRGAKREYLDPLTLQPFAPEVIVEVSA